MTVRQKIQVATLILVALIIFFARKDIVEAWHLLWQANIGILLLLIPIQFISYYAGGAGVFSYLRYKGDMKNISRLDQPKMALEFNFVNHVLPTAGASGMSYFAWRLQEYGVSAGRAALAQIVRFMTAFAAFAAMMVLSLGWLILDGNIDRYAVLGSVLLVVLLVVLFFVTFIVIGNKRRVDKFSNWLCRFINGTVRKLFRVKKKKLVSEDSVKKAFDELHDDFMEIMKRPRQLLAPFLWGVVFNLAEVGLFYVTFLSLGYTANPALLLIAIGLAGAAGIVFVTPGGAGGYELVMITYLTYSGMPLTVATAGVVLARTILITLTITTGYFFYHRALEKHGKPAVQR